MLKLSFWWKYTTSKNIENSKRYPFKRNSFTIKWMNGWKQFSVHENLKKLKYSSFYTISNFISLKELKLNNELFNLNIIDCPIIIYFYFSSKKEEGNIFSTKNMSKIIKFWNLFSIFFKEKWQRSFLLLLPTNNNHFSELRPEGFKLCCLLFSIKTRSFYYIF